MNKTIVIGVGGTGLKAIKELRKLIIEHYGSLDRQEVQSLGFLYIDTDRSELVVTKDNQAKWQFLGQSIALSPSEYVIVEGADLQGVMKNIDAYDNIKEWLPREDMVSINTNLKSKEGASQIRPLGRFIFATDYERIKAAFINVYNRIPQGDDVSKTNIFMICSLSGGTGGGMFLDLAYLLQGDNRKDSCRVIGFLVLPEMTTDRGERYHVNAYASLMELNYFALCGNEISVDGVEKTINFRSTNGREIAAAPFQNCYLVGTANDEGVEIDLDAVPAMIAHRIFLNCDSAFTTEAARLLDNANAERGFIVTDEFTGNKQSRNFLSFGLSSIQYPIELFLDVFSYKLSKALVDQWYEEKDYPGDIHSKVMENLPTLKLTDEYLLGDKDFFGSKHNEFFETEVDRAVNSLKEKPQVKGNEPFLNTKLDEYTDGFRGVGINSYYSQKRDTSNFEGALREANKLLRKQLSADLADQGRGYEYCQKMLDAMIKLFSDKRAAFVDKLNSLPNQEKNSRATFNKFKKEVTEIENSLNPILKEKKLKTAIDKACEAMKLNLSARIGLRAYDFGIAFVKAWINELEGQKIYLKSWRDAMESLRNDLEAEITKRIQEVERKIENKKEFNGMLLFSEEKMEETYEKLDKDSASSFIEREILKNFADGILDIQGSNPEMFYKVALTWLQTQSVYKISESNVADKLVEEYKDPIERRQHLSSVFRKSCPFITINKNEIGQKLDGYSLQDSRYSAKVIGIMNPATVREVDNLNNSIQDITAATSREYIKWISDRHQILFLQEYAAFPLRIIKDFEVLKEKYDEYIRKALNAKTPSVPLHISKTFDPPLMDLYLTSTKQINRIQKIDEAFFIARTLGKLQLTENKLTGGKEVRFKYLEGGAEVFKNLGRTWEQASENLKNQTEEIHRFSEKLTSEVDRYMKGVNSKKLRDALWFKLDGTIRELREELEHGEDDPIYKTNNIIRNRIVLKYNLYDEYNQPDPINKLDESYKGDLTKVPPLPQNPPSSEKYTNLVRTSLRSSKDGILSDAMTKMLRSNQEKYGIDEATASKIMEEVRSEMFGSQKEREYQELFEAFYDDGEITDEESAFLVDRQHELDLTDEQVQKIKTSVISKKGGK